MNEINGKLIEERYQLYMEKHWDEVIADVDNRVEKMVKKTIKETFDRGYRDKSLAEKLIHDKVDEVASKVIENMEVDKREIERIIKTKMERKAKAINIDIALK